MMLIMSSPIHRSFSAHSTTSTSSASDRGSPSFPESSAQGRRHRNDAPDGLRPRSGSDDGGGASWPRHATPPRPQRAEADLEPLAQEATQTLREIAGDIRSQLDAVRRSSKVAHGLLERGLRNFETQLEQRPLQHAVPAQLDEMVSALQLGISGAQERLSRNHSSERSARQSLQILSGFRDRLTQFDESNETTRLHTALAQRNVLPMSAGDRAVHQPMMAEGVVTPAAVLERAAALAGEINDLAQASRAFSATSSGHLKSIANLLSLAVDGPTEDPDATIRSLSVAAEAASDDFERAVGRLNERVSSTHGSTARQGYEFLVEARRLYAEMGSLDRQLAWLNRVDEPPQQEPPQQQPQDVLPFPPSAVVQPHEEQPTFLAFPQPMWPPPPW